MCRVGRGERGGFHGAVQRIPGGSRLTRRDTDSARRGLRDAGRGIDDQPAWSRDGSRMAFQRFGDLWQAFATGGGPWALVQLPYEQFAPAWSLDGLLVAFTSKDANGLYQVFTVRPST